MSRGPKRGKSIWSRRADDYEALVKRSECQFPTFYCPEPKLRFTGNRYTANPKRGIAEFGPLDELRSRSAIRLGVVGTPESIDHFSTYLASMSHLVTAGVNAREKHFDPIVFPDFPGANLDSAFRTEIKLEQAHQRVIPHKLFEHDLKPSRPESQIKNVVTRIGDELDVLGDLDSQPDVVVIIMPPMVQDACQHVGDSMRRRPVGTLTASEAFSKKMGSVQSRTTQSYFDFEFGAETAQDDRGYWNFHHALKARAMRSGIPTQLIWERSLFGEQTSQDPASIAWNLMTGLYYKSGNIPWEVEGLSSDTCFLGISFFKSGLYSGADTHTSLAQIFSGHGEGLVMKGGKAIKESHKPAHMDRLSAEALVRSALELYARHHPGTKARRLVVHKTSQFWPDEIDGIVAALPNDMRFDLVALSTESDIRFMRSGTHPPLRGTCIKLSERETAMFTVGYIPEFRMYPGAKIPRPIILTHERGDSTRETICQEFMALTKLNWNSCSYASKEPITTLFAASVGSIMAEYLALLEAERGEFETKYRFYM